MTSIPAGEKLAAIRKLLRVAAAFACEAAARRSELQASSKSGPLDPVTEVDLAVERMIGVEIATLFPGDRFWGEESGMPPDPGSGRIWICDPIDGTRSFLRFGHDYCLSLGLLIDGEIVLGMILDPARDDFYEAIRGAGATLNGRPLRLSPLPSLAHALIALGYSERVDPDRHADMVREFLRGGALTHQHGSGALALAQTAAGRLDAYVELHQNAWDALPGLLIAEEAGAQCLAWASGDLVKGTVTLAANPGIAPSLARIVIGPKDPEWGIARLSHKRNMVRQHS